MPNFDYITAMLQWMQWLITVYIPYLMNAFGGR